VEPGGPVWPLSTDLLVDGAVVATAAMTEGVFTPPLVIDIPADAGPGPHTLTTGCGGTATVEVLAAPTLDVTPAEAVRGQTVIATGTCPLGAEAVSVVLDDTDVTVVALGVDGRLGDVEVRIPDDAAAGVHSVTTSCGGSDTVTVSVPSTPSPDPQPDPDELVPVPNLVGLTAGQAATVLDRSGLVLDAPGSGAGRVTGQDPAAGALVPAGSSVGIVLAADDAAAFPLVPVAGGGGLLLLVLAATPLTVHRRRLHRERRWLDGDVAVTPGEPTPLPEPAVPGAEPGLDVRIEVHRGHWPPDQGGPEP
jgi:hypothetical protein